MHDKTLRGHRRFACVFDSIFYETLINGKMQIDQERIQIHKVIASQINQILESYPVQISGVFLKKDNPK